MARLTCHQPADRAEEIVTPRLVLRLLTRPALEACLAGDAAAAALALGATPAPDMLGPRSYLRYTLAELDRDPGYAPWGTRAILLRGTQTVAGTIRFHERPHPDRPHPLGGAAAEFGYEIAPPHRRQGYAAEAVTAMMGWARAEAGIARFIAAIAPANAPSLALAAHLGFTRIGQQIDEVDGPEDIFLRVLD